MKVSFWVWGLYALLGLGLEGLALFNGVPNDTLTGTIVWWLPQVWVVAAIAWLGFHFVQAYRDRGNHH